MSTSTSTRSITEALTQAIQAEGDGYHFYTMAASSTTDDQGRRIFSQLAQEELDHLRFLRTQHAALLDTGGPSQTARLGPRADLSGASPIFSAALRSRLREAHMEMSALSIGIQLELSAMRFYGALAQDAEDRQVKAFLAQLAEWETGHYEALLRQQEALKADYWSAGGFSPF